MRQMKNTKLLNSTLGLLMFVPVSVMAYQNDIKESSLKSLTYKESSGNFMRFKMKDGKLLINDEYLHPMQNEVQALYYKALESTPTTLTLAQELSKLSHRDAKLRAQNKDTLYRYLHRFNFAHVSRALEVKSLLSTFIKQNNLFEI
jgi:hypothetical protein